jgi:hypothetical protein
MIRLQLLAILLLIVTNISNPALAGLTLGLGLDYTPIARMKYVNNSDIEFEIVDNVAWQGRLLYDFNNGLRATGIVDFYKKKIHPGAFSAIDLSQWTLGFGGDYGYEITESGATLISAGMETGYGQLTSGSNALSSTSGSMWVSGMVGVRFLVAYNFWCELDYRLVWLEYEIRDINPKKFIFSGSCLRLALDYPISGHRDEGSE